LTVGLVTDVAHACCLADEVSHGGRLGRYLHHRLIGDTTFCVSVFDSLAMQLNAKKFGNDVAFFLTLPSEPIFYFDSERTAGDSYVKGMLDGEANQTAVRKLIQKCYMEDSSSRSLGLLSHVRPYSFKGCWSYKAASLMLWIYTRKHVIQSSLTE
ncbi:unnamed protein product, partial [Brassica napus]